MLLLQIERIIIQYNSSQTMEEEGAKTNGEDGAAEAPEDQPNASGTSGATKPGTCIEARVLSLWNNAVIYANLLASCSFQQTTPVRHVLFSTTQ